MHRISGYAAIGLVAVVVGAAPAFAPDFSSGSTGADGAFSPPAGITTLTVPPSAVFNFTTVTIAASATVKFTAQRHQHTGDAARVGNVTIAGLIDISGAAGGAFRSTAPIVGSNGGSGGPGASGAGAGPRRLVSTIGGSRLGTGGGTGSSGQSGVPAVPVIWQPARPDGPAPGAEVRHTASHRFSAGRRLWRRWVVRRRGPRRKKS